MNKLEFLEEAMFGVGKKNAPTFIYTILNGKPPYPPLVGQTSDHRQKIWNRIAVDFNIPDKALNNLLKIKEIEMRASCEGHSEERPTFLIIRLKDQREEYIKTFVEALNKEKDIVAGYGLGNKGFYRVGITIEIWHDKDPIRFKKWWLALPKKINNAFKSSYVSESCYIQEVSSNPLQGVVGPFSVGTHQLTGLQMWTLGSMFKPFRKNVGDAAWLIIAKPKNIEKVGGESKIKVFFGKVLFGDAHKIYRNIKEWETGTALYGIWDTTKTKRQGGFVKKIEGIDSIHTKAEFIIEFDSGLLNSPAISSHISGKIRRNK